MKKTLITLVLIISIISFSLVFAFNKPDIEEATLEEIQSVYGVGEILSERIVAYIDTDEYKDINDLINVEGIGKEKLKQIKKVFE